VSFPLVVFFRRVRPAFVVAAWLFHMGTVLLLGLDYTMWPATVTILLLDWPAIVDRVSGWRGRTVQATGASPPVHPAT